MSSTTEEHAKQAKNYKIAVIPGDGIGVEVIREGRPLPLVVIT
jgi:hypothetical protein